MAMTILVPSAPSAGAITIFGLQGKPANPQRHFARHSSKWKRVGQVTRAGRLVSCDIAVHQLKELEPLEPGRVLTIDEPADLASAL